MIKFTKFGKCSGINQLQFLNLHAILNEPKQQESEQDQHEPDQEHQEPEPDQPEPEQNQQESELEKHSEFLMNEVPCDLYRADGTLNYGKAALYIRNLMLCTLSFLAIIYKPLNIFKSDKFRNKVKYCIVKYVFYLLKKNSCKM